MSIVVDQVRRADTQLDRIQLIPPLDNPKDSESIEHGKRIAGSSRITNLQQIVKGLSTTSSSNPLLPIWRIVSSLQQLDFSQGVQDGSTASFESQLEWMVISKATVQTYGLLLSILLEQTIPLNDDIGYWDDVLGSYTNTGIYIVQRSPWNLWLWSKEVLHDARSQFARLKDPSATGLRETLADQWRQYYSLVRKSIYNRSVTDIQRRVLSPVAIGRSEARHNQARLKRFKEMSASGLGLLMNEALDFNMDEDTISVEHDQIGSADEWKIIVERTISLMNTVVSKVTALEIGVPEFEEAAFISVAYDQETLSHNNEKLMGSRPALLSDRLQEILRLIPTHISASRRLADTHGRPSRIVRYWLPASLLLLSSMTILRIFLNRKADIVTWFKDLGGTTRDFWFNWVVEPAHRVVGTIRHDKESEVALMSKESLRGDRDSLERMVVDFAVDNPESGMIPNDAEIALIRAKVKEGDLTPVLRAYERDLRKPFMGTVRGDLIRTLLIQVQKTKVDVEVALNGIDTLLKSQELVFGFVGLTPGLMVCLAMIRYFGNLFSSRRGLRKGSKTGQTIRILRNISRTLTRAVPTENNLLSYTDHGLLLCEVHVLRSRACGLLPGKIDREFIEDVNDLCNINCGIPVQLKVLERIRWGYSKWLT